MWIDLLVIAGIPAMMGIGVMVVMAMMPLFKFESKYRRDK